MRHSIVRSISAILLICLSPYAASASWLSDITGVDINLPRGSITFGPPRPDCIPMTLQNLPKDAAVFLLNPVAGNALALAIRQPKESARKILVPHASHSTETLGLFSLVIFFRAFVGQSLEMAFPWIAMQIHDAGIAAITFGDVVVFRSNDDGMDHAQAAAWYRKSAAPGDAAAQEELGGLYSFGRGVSQDEAQAAFWYRKAGDAKAQYMLGGDYASGQGVSQDFAEAYFWLDLAVAGNVTRMDPKDSPKLRDGSGQEPETSSPRF